MGIGAMIMPPIAHRLIAVYGWRQAYLIIAVGCFLLMIAAAQFLKHAPGEDLPAKERSNDSSEAPQQTDLTVKKILRTPQFWLLSILYFFFLYALLSILVHVAIHSTGIGIPPSVAANILGMIGGLCVVGMNLAGAAADRIGNRQTLMISFLLMTLSLGDLMFSFEVWHFYLFAALFGLAYGGMQVLFSPLVAELFGLGSHGVILGLSVFLGSLGAALGPFVSGYIFDASKSYGPAFLICLAMTIAGVFLPFFLKPVQAEVPQ
jgi:predicted MFS family arabinose efflux permease